MIIIGILLSIAAIGFLCWLLFTLAIFALPLSAGATASVWAYGTGAGWLGAIVVGVAAAALMFGIGQFLLVFVRPLWARIVIALAFVAPAAIAGYHAAQGIVKHTMPSAGWQVAFSIIGAVRHRCDGADAVGDDGHARFDRTEPRAGPTASTSSAGPQAGSDRFTSPSMMSRDAALMRRAVRTGHGWHVGTLGLSS